MRTGGTLGTSGTSVTSPRAPRTGGTTGPGGTLRALYPRHAFWTGGTPPTPRSLLRHLLPLPRSRGPPLGSPVLIQISSSNSLNSISSSARHPPAMTIFQAQCRMGSQQCIYWVRRARLLQFLWSSTFLRPHQKTSLLERSPTLLPFFRSPRKIGLRELNG